jgi:hypothetical protein
VEGVRVRGFYGPEHKEKKFDMEIYAVAELVFLAVAGGDALERDRQIDRTLHS